MNISTPVEVALVTAAVTLIGYFVSNSLERQRATRLREMEFKLDRYKEFFLAFSELAGNQTFGTQLRFVSSSNVVLMIGSAKLLRAVKDLLDNFYDEKGTSEQQQRILDRIMWSMRSDLNAPDSKLLADFEFPVMIPNIEPPS